MKQLTISSFVPRSANNFSISQLFLVLFFMFFWGDVGWGQGGFAPCGTSTDNSAPILPNGMDCFPTTQHPIFVRIKAHILRPTNPGPNTGQPRETVRRAIARMQANFEPYKIYFVWDACDINFINNDEYYTAGLGLGAPILTTLKNLYGPSANEPNRIDIFFFPNDYISNTLGSALTIPSDVIGLGGNYSNLIPTIETFILSHEMGHCLGLYHTFQTNTSSVGEIECECEVYASQVLEECCACGDYVCDTKFYPAPLGFIGSNCDWTGTTTLPNCNIVFSDPETENFMNNPSLDCANEFTNGQGNRMRGIMTGDPYDVTQSGTGVSNLFSSLTIPSTNIPNIWTTGMFPNNQVIIYEDLTIEGGSTLEIQAGVKVIFARKAKLIVKQNALLKLTGVLTGMCNDYWQGVKVFGKSGVSFQYPINGVYAQGRIEGYEKSIIENAVTGVELYGGGGNGGQINCKGTLFRNNQIGVSFRQYANNIPAISQVGSVGNQNYKARFNGYKFETNDNYLKTLLDDNKIFYAFLDMTKVRGVQIGSCNFINTKTEICANSSTTTCRGFGIHANSAGFDVGTSLNSTIDCQFTGLEEAIHNISNLSTRPVSVRNAHFTDNYVGIYLENVLGASITGNEFYLGNMPGNPTVKKQFGTIFAQSSEFFYVGNMFYKVDGNAETTVGTCNYNIGSANNVVSQNQYSDIHVANVANRNNGELPNNITSGLYYECNTNEGVTAYDFVLPNGADRIRTNQGKFVGFDPFTQKVIYQAAGNRFSHQGTCQFSDFYKSAQNINYYYADPLLPGNQFQEPLYHNLSIPFLKKAQANTCFDFGYNGGLYRTSEELNTIRNEYFTARNNFVTARNNWVNTNLSGNPTQIENTERVAGLHRLTMYDLAKKGFLHALHDTINYSEDSLRAWQGRLWTYESDVRLALSYGFAGQSAEATQVIGQIPQRYALSATQQADLSNIQTLINIGSSQNLSNLDMATQSAILQIAQDPNDGIAA
jgi:hypothetical protein